MARRYAPDHKALIMLTLERNNGDIPLTSVHTGVPERTLRFWRQTWQPASAAMPQNSRQRPDLRTLLPPEIADLETAKEADVFKFLREQLMRSLLEMVTTFVDEMDAATFHQRVNALTRLIDRFPKVTSWLPIDEATVYRIEYKHPDGSIHDLPPWALENKTWINTDKRRLGAMRVGGSDEG